MEAGAPDRALNGIRVYESNRQCMGWMMVVLSIHQTNTMASALAPDFQPPLPNEPEPVVAPPRPAAIVVSDEEEDDAPRGDKGKAKADDAGSDGDVWDPAAAGKELEGRKVEEKQTTTTETTGTTATSSGTDTGGWQAVWAPAQNGKRQLFSMHQLPERSADMNSAYYFWNAQTGAVQWENPLVQPSAPPLPDEPAPAGSSSGTAWDQSTPAPEVTEAALPPIDPALSHLLPASQRPGLNTPSADAHLYQSAQFNARTGRFTPRDYTFTVDHLAEANRARRQEEAFFDVAEWEREKEREVKRKREAEERGEVPRKLTKKDMERFRAKKQERKMRNNAWLKG